MSAHIEKDVWTAYLPPFRDGATGRLHQGTVYVLTVLHQDRSRYVRVEIAADHARALAADLLKAADKADNRKRVA